MILEIGNSRPKRGHTCGRPTHRHAENQAAGKLSHEPIPRCQSAHNLDTNSYCFLLCLTLSSSLVRAITIMTFQEMVTEIQGKLTTTLASTEVGRMLQLFLAADMKVKHD